MSSKYTMRPLEEGEIIPPEELTPLRNHPPSRSPFYRALERIRGTMPDRLIEFATYERSRTAQEIIDAIESGDRPVPVDDNGGTWEFKATMIRLEPGEHEGTGTIVGSRLYVKWNSKKN